jgi:hypothetical protein
LRNISNSKRFPEIKNFYQELFDYVELLPIIFFKEQFPAVHCIFFRQRFFQAHAKKRMPLPSGLRQTPAISLQGFKNLEGLNNTN